MSEPLHLQITQEEASLILTALSNLPYIQVHQLIHNLQAQLGPQLAAQTATAPTQRNGHNTQTTVA